jgi:glycosyltransferase involved in cell wall biosynthesis
MFFRKIRDFEKTRILNAGIRAASADFLIFIDGDCLPHPRFVSEYKRAARAGLALHGRRVMLSEKVSQQVLAGEVHFPPTLLQLVRSGSEKVEDALYLPWIQRKSRASAIWGCNWGIAKQHLIAVNGFDEEYESAGVGEDVDIEWRLLKHGVRLKNLKRRAIVYHLFHRSGYTDSQVQVNLDMMRDKIRKDLVFCARGLATGR